MLSVRVADYDADGNAIRTIRFAVFVDEQQVPAELEMDDADAHCIHVLAFDDETAIGTGRIDIARSGKVGRVAVLASHRGRGVGTAVMQAIHGIAHTHGLWEWSTTPALVSTS